MRHENKTTLVYIAINGDYLGRFFKKNDWNPFSGCAHFVLRVGLCRQQSSVAAF